MQKFRLNLQISANEEIKPLWTHGMIEKDWMEEFDNEKTRS